MKNVIAVFGLIVCTSSAFAGESALLEPTRLDTFVVKGEKAARVINALEGMGAKSDESAQDVSFLHVQKVQCNMGYVLGGGKYFQHCKLEQVERLGAMLPAFRHVAVEAEGEKAVAVFNALEDAGVNPVQHLESTSMHVDSIDCTRGMFFGHPEGMKQSCTIRLVDELVTD